MQRCRWGGSTKVWPSESLLGILSLSWSLVPERVLGCKVRPNLEAGASGLVPISHHLDSTATSWMSPPNLKGTVASQGLVTNLRFSHFAVTVGESTVKERERPCSWDPEEGLGTPPQLQRRGTLSLSGYSSDFIARKDLRKLVQPTDFRQLRCVFYFMGKTAEA